jgi:hypothetical protein
MANMAIGTDRAEHFLSAKSSVARRNGRRKETNSEPEFGAHARIRTGDLFLTKEVLVDHSPIGAPLRSNAEAIANNRCLAALPRKAISLLR